MMIHLTNRLDKLASDLEGKGLLKEAEELDTISNTLEHIAGSVKGPGVPDGTGPASEIGICQKDTKKGPGGHIPDGTGPHGRGMGPGKGRGDGTGKE